MKVHRGADHEITERIRPRPTAKPGRNFEAGSSAPRSSTPPSVEHNSFGLNQSPGFGHGNRNPPDIGKEEYRQKDSDVYWWPKCFNATGWNSTQILGRRFRRRHGLFLRIRFASKWQSFCLLNCKRMILQMTAVAEKETSGRTEKRPPHKL